jgi:hypothetical protein
VCIFINMKIIITENQQESLKKNLMNIIDRFGFVAGSNAVGSFDNMVKILYDGDISRIGENLKPPYYKNMKKSKVPSKFWTKILSNVFNQKVSRDMTGNVYGEKGLKIYTEGNRGWTKYEYDKNRNRIYSENSDGYWRKTEWDEDGVLVYREDSDGKITDNRSNKSSLS